MLEAEKPFPHDRIFAFARPGAPIDRNDPKWAKKGLFVMLMLDENLARVETSLDIETMRLTVRQGDRQVASAQLDDPADRAKIEEFFWQLLPTLPRRAGAGALGRRAFHGQAGQRHLADQSRHCAQPRAAMGRSDRPAALSRQHLCRRRQTVGGVRLGRAARSGSAAPCSPSIARTAAAARPTSIRPPAVAISIFHASLRAAFGHKDLGVYLIVREGGQIAVGDSVFVPRSVPAAAPSAAFPPPPLINHAQRRFICRGCYFIYEEANGLPQQSIKPGTQFADIPATWRCPDCGTDKSTFRPYVEKAAAS